MRSQPRRMSLAACISRCPSTTRWPWLANSLLPRNGSSTEGWASLHCRKSGSSSSRPTISTTQARVPTLPTPDDLAREVREAVALEQLAAIALEARAVGAQQRRACASSNSAACSGESSSSGRHDQRRVADDLGLAVDGVRELVRRPRVLSLRLRLRDGLAERLTGRALASASKRVEQLPLRRGGRTRRRGCPSPAKLRIACAVLAHRRRPTASRRCLALNPRSRPAIAMLAARRLRSHSHGPGERLVEVVDVEHEVALRRGEATEVREVGVAAELHLDPRARGPGQIGGHHVGGPAEEGERRGDHPPVADRDQLGHARRGLLLQQRDRIGAVGPRLPLGVARAGRLRARRSATCGALLGGEVRNPRPVARRAPLRADGCDRCALLGVSARHLDETIPRDWVSRPHSPWVSMTSASAHRSIAADQSVGGAVVV